MAESLTGKFLISVRRLRDPNFYQSVVLIVEHGAGGAMGLIINRPSSILVTAALEGHFELPETGALIYTGGPVEQSALFILHNAREFQGTESPVVPGLFVGSSAEVFEQVVRRVAAGQQGLEFRIYAGCAGWAPQQLEGELARGDWLVYPASLEYIFHKDPYSVWDALIKRSAPPGFVAQAADDPEWN